MGVCQLLNMLICYDYKIILSVTVNAFLFFCRGLLIIQINGNLANLGCVIVYIAANLNFISTQQYI